MEYGKPAPLFFINLRITRTVSIKILIKQNIDTLKILIIYFK